MANMSEQEKERKNYELAHNKMKSYVGQPLSHDIIKSIHATVMGSEEVIEYREGFGSPPVRNPVTREVRYSPPCSGSRSIKKLMQDLIDLCAQKSSAEKKATQLHWGIAKIHPFDEGNGRTARLLVQLVLLNGGYSLLVCDGLEEYFETHRKEYDDSLHDGKRYYTDSLVKEINPEFYNFIKKGIEGSTKS